MNSISSLSESLPTHHPKPKSKTMDIFSNNDYDTENQDRTHALKVFDEMKTGVKGLVDAGVTKIPKIFIRPHDELVEELNCSKVNLQIPVIDLSGIEGSDRRAEIVEQVRDASENWGFFQVVNHEISRNLLDETVDCIRMFHEQDVEVKMKMYSRDQTKRVRFESNIDLYQSRVANWRDTLTLSMLVSDDLDRDEVPAICRETILEYIKHVTKLGDTLMDILSEALGLKPDHLKDMECSRGRSVVCHYYPPCPEPELTLGSSKHTDPSFLTLLLQDHIGGLQVRHGHQWADVPHVPGGLIVNIGDLLQIVSNDKFKSVEHRVLANVDGPRISAACFFIGVIVPPKVYGPIKELSSKPAYKDFLVVNHGIPMKVFDEMLNRVREFNEQDVEVKKGYYSRDPMKMVKFNTNYDFYMSRAANWRDTLIVDMLNSYHLDPQELPSVCRDATIDYLNHLTKLVDTLFELLSEALGLEPNHLKQLECEKGRTLACHYYPACPAPDQTLGVSKHTDASFITILLQDEVGGLEVLHGNQWAEVEPVLGALVVNIGDLLQILSNDKFKSVIHRAFGNQTRTRTSVACFFHGVATPAKIYGPIKEVITKESPPVFREFTIQDYMMKFYSRGLDEKSGLNYVRI